MSSAYGHRYRWPRFASAWDEAVEVGSEGIESARIAGATAYLEGEPGEIDGAVRINSIGEAIKVLRMGSMR